MERKYRPTSIPGVYPQMQRSYFRHIIPTVHAEAQEIQIAPPKVIDHGLVQAYIDSEDGMTRLRNMYSKDDMGKFTPDMRFVMFGTGQAAIVTFLFGYLIGARQASHFYVQRHQAAKYETRFKAMRSYYDAVVVGGVAHGFRYAVKVGTFTGLFMLTSQSIATYRNKSSPLEYTVGGVLTGGLLRLNLGIKGFIGGGILGGVLGLTGGLLMWGVMCYSGERQQDRYFNYVVQMMIEKRRLQTIQTTAMQRAAGNSAAHTS